MEKEQLRDHFAGLAMQSLLSRSDVSEKILSLKPGQIYSTEIANISKFSYIIADQMLNAKNGDKIIKNKVIQETRPDWAR